MDKYVRNRISINRIFIDRKKKVMDAFYKTNVIVQLSFIKKHIQPYIYTHFITSILIRFSKFIVNLNDLNDIFIFIESLKNIYLAHINYVTIFQQFFPYFMCIVHITKLYIFPAR